jgi:hypothetical protein
MPTRPFRTVLPIKKATASGDPDAVVFLAASGQVFLFCALRLS